MLKPGTKIVGRYRLVLPLGERRTGAVWQSLDEETNSKVAIAIVDPRGEGGEQRVADFLETMKKARDIDDFQVVKVMDSGEAEEGQGYAVTEYLEGMSLGERLAEEPTISLSDFLLVATQALEGLAVLHEAEVTHGDIEPGNIFLLEGTGRPSVKLIGIGHSRAEAWSGAKEEDPEDASFLRSLAYASPEQARRLSKIDARSDIYSMGVVVFEAVAGRLPHLGASADDLREAILGGAAPALHTVREEIPKPLSQVIQKATSVDPSARHESARAMQQALLTSMLMASEKVKKSPLPVRERGVHRPSQAEGWAFSDLGIDDDDDLSISASSKPKPSESSKPKPPASSKPLSPKKPVPVSDSKSTDGKDELAKKKAEPAKKTAVKRAEPAKKAAPSTEKKTEPAKKKDGPAEKKGSGALGGELVSLEAKKEAGKRLPKPPPKTSKGAKEDASEDTQDIDVDDLEAVGEEVEREEAAKPPIPPPPGPGIRIPPPPTLTEAPAGAPMPPPPKSPESDESRSSEVDVDVEPAVQERDEEKSSTKPAAPTGSDEEKEKASEEEEKAPSIKESAAIAGWKLAEEAPAGAEVIPGELIEDSPDEEEGGDDDDDLFPRKSPPWLWIGVGGAAAVGALLAVVFFFSGGDDEDGDGRELAASMTSSSATEVDAGASAVETDAAAAVTPEEPAAEPAVDASAAGAADGAASVDAAEADAAEEPTAVQVVLRGLPNRSRVRLDGAAVVGTSFEVEADGEEHAIVVSAVGYRRWRHIWTPTEDTTLSVDMQEIRTSSGSRGSSGGRRGGAKLVRDPGF